MKKYFFQKFFVIYSNLLEIKNLHIKNSYDRKCIQNNKLVNRLADQTPPSNSHLTQNKNYYTQIIFLKTFKSHLYTMVSKRRSIIKNPIRLKNSIDKHSEHNKKSTYGSNSTLNSDHTPNFSTKNSSKSNDTDSEGYQSGLENNNNIGMENAKIITPGPYRATKLWRSLVRNFTTDMPVKTHSTHLGLKIYESSFTGAEAIDYLNDYLIKNPNYGSSVTREQTSLLLKKLVEQKIILPITSSSFKDSKDIYKFAENLPNYLNSPVSRLNITQHSSKKVTRKLFSNDSTIITPSSPSKKLTDGEVNQLRKLVISRIICSLGVSNLDDLGIDESQVNACDIYWNCVKVNKTGITHSEKENDPRPPIKIFHYRVLVIKIEKFFDQKAKNCSHM